jgi:hypothetical protein
LSNAARAIAFLRDRFEGVAGDILLTALSEPKEADVGRPREYRLSRPVDIERLAQIIAKEDRPGRALFFCVGTLSPDATKSAKGFWRLKGNILQLPGLHVDVDFKHLALPPALNPTAEVTRQMIRSRWAPAPIVITGGGMHGYWRSAQPIGRDDFEQAEAVMKALARHFGGDPSVAEVSRLMRLPGTSNWKYGEPRRCLVSLHGEATIDIWDEEVGAGEPLFVEIASAPASPWPRRIAVSANAFEAYAAEHATPIDWSERLAGMDWHGAGESGVHATQVSVTAAMLNAGASREDTIEQVLGATMAKPFAAGWNERLERRTVTGMVDSFVAKLTAEGRTVPHVNGGDGEPKPTAQPSPGKATKAPPIAWPVEALIGLEPDKQPRREWLYGHHYVRQFVSGTIGIPGAGKSNLIIAEVVALVSQSNLLGEHVEEPLRVWYHNGEDPLDELKRRFAAILKHYQVTEEQMGGRLFVTSGRDLKLNFASPGLHGELKRDETTIARTKRTIIDNGIDVLIVDPLVAVHRVEENSNTLVAEIVEIFAEIARDCHCAVELVHHSRKTGGEEVTVEHARGASALIAGLRSARVLNTMTKKEAGEFRVTSERRRYFKVENGKSSMFVPSDEADWFESKPVSLGNGFGGSDGDSVGAVTRWEPPGTFENITHVMIGVALDTVRKGVWRHDVRSPAWVGKAIASVLDLDADEQKDTLKRIIKQWITNNILKVVMGKDSDGKEREFIEVGPAAPVRQS